jgi:hypothetical protein
MHRIHHKENSHSNLPCVASACTTLMLFWGTHLSSFLSRIECDMRSSSIFQSRGFFLLSRLLYPPTANACLHHPPASPPLFAQSETARSVGQLADTAGVRIHLHLLTSMAMQV